MLSPVEAAALLGVSPSAASHDVESAYLARLHVVPASDVETRDRLTAARDALVAAARWQAPGVPGAPLGQPVAPVQQPVAPVRPGPPQQVTAPPYPQQPYGAQPAPQQPSPQQPYLQPYGAQPYPQQPYGAQPYGAPPHPQSSQPPYAPYPYAQPYQPHQPYPAYAPPRRGPSTGAIVGWVLGGFAVLLVIVVVAVVAIVGSARSQVSYTDAGGGSSDSASGEYVVDGVRVEYNEDGWDFTLTSPRDCPAATVTVGFGDDVSGPAQEEFTDTVALEAGQPHVYSVPYDASSLQYASIDAIDCGT
ncbi:hypothetical protein ACI2IX_00115 [Leifsonia aquatica]|uniref:hypothetical protein n=1 Tax=Leifsonia aquatica TaxID=144185 RepID=UPI0038503302